MVGFVPSLGRGRSDLNFTRIDGKKTRRRVRRVREGRLPFGGRRGGDGVVAARFVGPKASTFPFRPSRAADPLPGPRSAARAAGNVETRPRTEPDHPPNLSILISGGKETNRDTPSSGERRGFSSSLKSGPASRGVGIVVLEPAVDDARRGGVVGSSDLERSAAEGESPVGRASASPSSSTEAMSSSALSRVGLFEIAAQKRVVDPIQS